MLTFCTAYGTERLFSLVFANSIAEKSSDFTLLLPNAFLKLVVRDYITGHIKPVRGVHNLCCHKVGNF